MAKRQKLSIQQKRRVARSQQKKLSAQTNDLPDDSQLGALQQGIVISRFGEQADVSDENRRIYRCYLRQHLGSCVSGDRVNFRPDTTQVEQLGDEQPTNQEKASPANGGVIEVINPRANSLKRPTAHGGVKTIVANVDQIFVVVAPLPEYSSLMLDRYLVACELSDIDTTVLLNKTDLITEEQESYFNEQLDIYRNIGYQCHRISAKGEFPGKAKLLEAMSGKENIFVGQSGVGKSSLINCILPNASANTQEVSVNSKLGTHTTTASRLYFLPNDGHIIDSPGVREFGLWHLEPERLLDGFRELRTLSGECKFRNCRHINEKGCAITDAASQQKVSPLRVKNFQKIYHQLLQQVAR